MDSSDGDSGSDALMDSSDDDGPVTGPPPQPASTQGPDNAAPPSSPAEARQVATHASTPHAQAVSDEWFPQSFRPPQDHGRNLALELTLDLGSRTRRPPAASPRPAPSGSSTPDHPIARRRRPRPGASAPGRRMLRGRDLTRRSRTERPRSNRPPCL